VWTKPHIRKLWRINSKALSVPVTKNALFIVRGVVANQLIEEAGAQAPELVDAILKPDCPVSFALTEQDKTNLRLEAEQASKQ
jgi:serine/threonine-protein kinase RIO1